MTKTIYEFRKGVLFVRFKGVFGLKDYNILKKNLMKLINNIGVRYLVFNIKELEYNNNLIKKLLLDNNNIINKNQGKLMVCGSNIEALLTKLNITSLNNELEAFLLKN